MMSGSEEVREALDKIDIEAWMESEGVEFRVARGSRGVQLNVRECPCCGSSSWKVYINQETGLGNCFSGDCEVKFNKWKFIKATHGGLSTRELVEHVKATAKSQGWRPVRRSAVAINLNTDLKLPESIALPFQGRNLRYLDNRNITSSVAQYFSLRFSRSGVFRYKNNDGKTRAQSYANRILIPVFDLDGDLATFQGRDITGTAENKYIFPPGFESTGSHLYNGQNAHGATSVVVGEGAFDVMATKIALDGDPGLREVVPVGTFGKHLSSGSDESQLAKFIKLQEEGLKVITFMWDGEKKAIDAACDSALMLRKYGFTCRIALLPNDCDPNEVPAQVVRDAYWRAQVVNESVVARLRLARRTA